MFGKKKKNDTDKLTVSQKYGISLIDAISDNLNKIAAEVEACPRSAYAMEVERAITKLSACADAAKEKVLLANTLPFSDVQEVSYYGE